MPVGGGALGVLTLEDVSDSDWFGSRAAPPLGPGRALLLSGAGAPFARERPFSSAFA